MGKPSDLVQGNLALLMLIVSPKYFESSGFHSQGAGL